MDLVNQLPPVFCQNDRNEQRTIGPTPGSLQAHSVTKRAHPREISPLLTSVVSPKLFRGQDTISKNQRRVTAPRAAGASCEIASTHRPCSRMRSTNRSTACASGILNFTGFLPT